MARQVKARHYVTVYVPQDLYELGKERQICFSKVMAGLLERYLHEEASGDAGLMARAERLRRELADLKGEMASRESELAKVDTLLEKVRSRKRVASQTLLADFQRMYPTLEKFQAVRSTQVRYLMIWVEKGLADSVDELARMVPEVMRNDKSG